MSRYSKRSLFERVAERLTDQAEAMLRVVTLTFPGEDLRPFRESRRPDRRLGARDRVRVGEDDWSDEAASRRRASTGGGR